jgi:hypothetical protein
MAAPPRGGESPLSSTLDIHAAFVAGYELGKAERVDFEIEDQVQARIHGRVREALGMAKLCAAAKGPAWSALIAECGESE